MEHEKKKQNNQMIMKLKIARLLSLMMVMFTMFSMSAYAGSSYYSKVTAKAVGAGKVYVKYVSTEDPTNYATESSATSGKQSAQDHKYFLYAQADAGNAFAGWFDNEACDGSAVSMETVFTVTVNATSTDSGSPTTEAYYAKFVDASAPILGYAEARVYANLSAGTYKNETLTVANVTGTISYELSNENVATVAADGTVTLKKNGSCIVKAKAGELEATYILTVIDDAAAGVTQIGNGDFENWSNVSSSNHAPYNWNSFETAEGTWASTASAVQVAMLEGGRPGSDGLYCVDIWSRTVAGVVAQGTLTTGCLNAGAMSAEAKANNSFSMTSDPSRSETISKVPSAVKMWVRFVPAATNADYPNAHVAVTVHDAHDYVTYSKDSYDDDTNKSYAIAHAVHDFPACEWTELTIPFEPTGNTTDGQMYILFNMSTNATPGQGQANDHLYVDDIELVYPEEGPEPVIYDKYIGIIVNGTQMEPVAAPIEVTYNDDNTIDFNLKNFSMNLGGTPANVGNITLPGLAMDEEGHFTFNGDIQITAGDKEGVTTWIGPMLGEIPLVLDGTITDDYFYVHIDISLSGQVVEVEVGDLATATVSVSDALISTFCAPFTIAIPADYQSYVTASTVTGVVDRVLTLEPVENYIIPAHTPVIVQIPMAYELPVSGIYVKGTPTAGLLTGVYENTLAPVGSYVLQNNSNIVGFYQVAAGSQPTVGANRCYLTVPESGVKAFFFSEDDATAIQTIDNRQQTTGGDIYNLAGQRLSKMQRGINIINGKKILK